MGGATGDVGKDVGELTEGGELAVAGRQKCLSGGRAKVGLE